MLSAEVVEISVQLKLLAGSQPVSSHAIPSKFRPLPLAEYVPKPRAVASDYLVGAFMCPLWTQGTLGHNWDTTRPYVEREPALGWYDEGSPEVTDWEVTWCLEHGLSSFVPCWYRERTNLGQPVRHVLGHWLHEGLLQARYGDRIRFAILWENGNATACGVESEKDLLESLFLYWMDHYLQRSNYLKLHGNPLLFIYRPETLGQELGGDSRLGWPWTKCATGVAERDWTV